MTDLEKLLSDKNRQLTIENQNLKLVVAQLLSKQGLTTEFISGVFADCRRHSYMKVYKEEN